MKKLLSITAIVLGLACLGAFLSSSAALPEPAYQGRTVSALLRDLSKGDWQTRNDASAALFAIGPGAAPFLVRALEKRPNPIEELLLRAGRFVPALRVEPSTTPLLRQCAAEQLGALSASDPGSIRALVRACAEKDHGVVEEAQRALRRIGSQSVPELRVALGSRNARLRKNAAEVLGDFRGEAAAAVPELLRLLDDREPRVRAQAAKTLGAVDAVSAVPGLVDALADRSPIVRAAAAESLGAFGPRASAARPRLNVALRDANARVRIAAARAVWLIASDAATAVPVLIGALQDPVAGWEATLALGEIGPAASDAVPALVETMKREKVPRPLRGPPSSALALGRIGPAAVPELVKTLEHDEPRIRSAGAIALGFIGEGAAGAAPKLVPLLTDLNGEVRQAATLSLGSIDPRRRELVPALVKMARDEDIFLSSAAAGALQKIDPETAATVVRE